MEESGELVDGVVSRRGGLTLGGMNDDGECGCILLPRWAALSFVNLESASPSLDEKPTHLDIPPCLPLLLFQVISSTISNPLLHLP